MGRKQIMIALLFAFAVSANATEAGSCAARCFKINCSGLGRNAEGRHCALKCQITCNKDQSDYVKPDTSLDGSKYCAQGGLAAHEAVCDAKFANNAERVSIAGRRLRRRRLLTGNWVCYSDQGC